MTLALSGLQTKIDSDFYEFREQKDLDEWLARFEEVVEYVKERAKKTVFNHKTR